MMYLTYANELVEKKKKAYFDLQENIRKIQEDEDFNDLNSEYYSELHKSLHYNLRKVEATWMDYQAALDYREMVKDMSVSDLDGFIKASSDVTISFPKTS